MQRTPPSSARSSAEPRRSSGRRLHDAALVKQEVWALLITHYAVRAFITEAADDLGADPDRYSFTRAINVIRRQVLNQAAISPLRTPQIDA